MSLHYDKASEKPAFGQKPGGNLQKAHLFLSRVFSPASWFGSGQLRDTGTPFTGGERACWGIRVMGRSAVTGHFGAGFLRHRTYKFVMVVIYRRRGEQIFYLDRTLHVESRGFVLMIPFFAFLAGYFAEPC